MPCWQKSARKQREVPRQRNRRQKSALRHLRPPIVNVVNQNVRVEKYPFHRSIMCAKCSSRAISSSVTFTMPRSFLNSAGTCLLVFGSSIDSVRYVTTMRFCSRVMPRSSAAYGAIGVSLILCANVVIILTCLISRCKNSANRVKYKINRIYFYLLYLASRTATVGSEMQPIFERATLKVTKIPIPSA